MKAKIEELRKNMMEQINQVSSTMELEKLRIEILGKKGKLSEIMSGMRNLSKEEKPVIGQLANEVRDYLTDLLSNKGQELKIEEKKKRILDEEIDITLTSKKITSGGLHPITKTMRDLKNIFLNMGFDVASGPEIEGTNYNFDALNIPENHSSRDLQDTFYIDKKTVLRTHTSPVQIRYMLENKPSFKMVCPGKVYRNDYDVSHTPMFHQMEGLVVGENISFANLKAILIELLSNIFGKTNVRFRPHFFPFTEPSAEVDVECVICKGKGCRVCKDSGWLEIMGCGMVDPEVFDYVKKEIIKNGKDANEYNNVTGFAFGLGIERIAMLLHGITDLRAFYENDKRFLNQFK